jgi:phenylacetate-CoA ligase
MAYSVIGNHHLPFSDRPTKQQLEQLQIHKLNQMLTFLLQYNRFYQKKLEGIKLPLRSKADLKRLPFTTKKELVEDQKQFPPYGQNHTFSVDKYIRYHQTSGTTGKPIKILDTEESWNWWAECWVKVCRSAGITEQDIVFLAFHFGPFIGFWAAYEGAKKAGALVFPGGGQTSEQRLTNIIENKATVLMCTPSYALHLAEVAKQRNIDIKNSSIKTIITAGEPGGSIPSVRQQIESLWGAKLFDHVGMTEMGAYGYSCSEQNGLHVNEEEFILEVINPETGEPVQEGERGELVLTNLGRLGYPLVRYRTGDMVIYSEKACPCGNPYHFLPGGIIGRADDMVVIRGINIFPQSIEAIVREFKEIDEFRIVYYTQNHMDQIKVQVEGEGIDTAQLKKRLRERIGLRIDVEQVSQGTLPRFEMKSRRVVDQRER